MLSEFTGEVKGEIAALVALLKSLHVATKSGDVMSDDFATAISQLSSAERQPLQAVVSAIVLSPVLSHIMKIVMADGTSGQFKEMACAFIEQLVTFGPPITVMIKKSELGIVDALVQLASREGLSQRSVLSAKRALEVLHVCFDGVDVDTLVETLRSSESSLTLKVRACDTLKSICQADEYKAMLASRNLGYVSVLFGILNSPFDGVLTPLVVESLQCLAKSNPNNSLSMASPETDFLGHLIEQIRTHEKRSLGVTISCSLLCTLLAYDKRNAHHIITAGLHKDAMRFIQEGGLNPLNWGGNNTAEGWSVYILMLLASAPEISAKSLREAGASEVIGPLISYDHLIGMMSAISIAFMTDHEEDGSESSSPSGSSTSSSSAAAAAAAALESKSESSSPSGSESITRLLKANPAVVERVVDLLDDALHNRKGKGYSKRTFMLSMVVHAVKCLVVKNVNTETFDTIRMIRLFLLIFDMYANNQPMGNEGSEEGRIACVRLSLEALNHISSRSFSCLSSSFAIIPVDHSLAIQRNLKGMSGQILISLHNLRNCSKYALLGEGAHGLVAALLANLPTERTLTRHDAIFNLGDLLGQGRSVDEYKHKHHIVVSRLNRETGPPESTDVPPGYAELEDLLIGTLKSMGYDVWTAETGSEVQPYGSVGSRDPAMEAVDRSHAVITCISAAYLKNVSYRMEIIYADIKKKEGGLKEVFLLLDDSCDPANSTHIDDSNIAQFRTIVKEAGLHYRLQDEDDIVTAADAIAGLLGEKGKLRPETKQSARSLSDGDDEESVDGNNELHPLKLPKAPSTPVAAPVDFTMDMLDYALSENYEPEGQGSPVILLTQPPSTALAYPVSATCGGGYGTSLTRPGSLVSLPMALAIPIPIATTSSSSSTATSNALNGDVRHRHSHRHQLSEEGCVSVGEGEGGDGGVIFAQSAVYVESAPAEDHQSRTAGVTSPLLAQYHASNPTPIPMPLPSSASASLNGRPTLPLSASDSVSSQTSSAPNSARRVVDAEVEEEGSEVAMGNNSRVSIRRTHGGRDAQTAGAGAGAGTGTSSRSLRDRVHRLFHSVHINT